MQREAEIIEELKKTKHIPQKIDTNKFVHKK